MHAEHPLPDLLRRITATAPTIRQWSQGWADAHLVPLLREIEQSLAQSLPPPHDLNTLTRVLRERLKERDETRTIAFATPPGSDLKAVDSAGKPLPDHVPRDGRIPNEIPVLIETTIEALTAPAPPAEAKA